ncbi:kinase-like domain-containing protein [Spinellus fusiger]|nr:kinase-like domain-containing protein [Spinellus fusiger]
MSSLSQLIREPINGRPEIDSPSSSDLQPAAKRPPLSSITSFSRPTFITASCSAVSPIAMTPPSYTRSSFIATPGGSSIEMAASFRYSAQTDERSIHNYEIVDDLGQGAYGLVKLAVRIGDPERKKIVIKYIIKSRILVDCWTRDRKLGLVPMEIHILHTLRRIPHENCSEMLDYFEDEDNYYVIMELHGDGMDLFDYIELKNGMLEPEIRDIFRQVALAVKHLHHHKIVHRDIKDENVILDQQGGVRLIDFGSAAYLREGRRYETFVGTLDYAAPEILRGQTYEGPPQDIWALGILLYTLMYRENPFYDIDEIMAHELRVPFTVSTGSLDLITKMLDRDVNKRLTISEVLAHPWLSS